MSAVHDLRPDGIVWRHDFPARDDRPAWRWTHYDLVSAAARACLEADPDLPPSVRRVLTGTDEAPRVIVAGDVVAGVLPSFARDGGTDSLELASWHFALLRGRLLTARRHSSRSLLAVYRAVEQDLVPHGPATLIDLALADFVRTARARLAVLGDELDGVEDALLDLHRGSSATAEAGRRLGPVRRECVSLKRVLTPVLRALDDPEEELPDWAHPPEHDATHNAAVGALDEIAALQDRARSLQDELTTRLSEETNRRLYIVSVVTTLGIPAAFVTGFFGMNTGGMLWSGEDTHLGTLYAAAACVAAVLTTLGLLRWKRLL